MARQKNKTAWSVRAAVFLLIILCLPSLVYSQTDETGRINKLIEDLEDGDPDIRWSAAAKLEGIGIPAITPLIAAMKTKNPDTRRMLVEILGKIGSPAIEPLKAALKDDNPRVREGAVEIFGRTRKAGFAEPLIAALRDDDPQVRERAIHAMLWFRDARAVEPLIKSLNDSNADIRRAAAEVLLVMKDKRAIEPLIALLKDKNPAIRKIAADALWEMRNTDAVKALFEVLQDIGKKKTALREEARKFVLWEREYLHNNSDRMEQARREAAMALEEYKEKEYKEKLLLDEKLKVVYRTYPFFIRSGDALAEPILIDAFSKFEDKEMLIDFLNCGNQRLMQAALGWANLNGVFIKSDTSSSGPRWGHR